MAGTVYMRNLLHPLSGGKRFATAIRPVPPPIPPIITLRAGSRIDLGLGGRVAELLIRHPDRLDAIGVLFLRYASTTRIVSSGENFWFEAITSGPIVISYSELGRTLQ